MRHQAISISESNVIISKSLNNKENNGAINSIT